MSLFSKKWSQFSNPNLTESARFVNLPKLERVTCRQTTNVRLMIPPCLGIQFSGAGDCGHSFNMTFQETSVTWWWERTWYGWMMGVFDKSLCKNPQLFTSCPRNPWAGLCLKPFQLAWIGPVKVLGTGSPEATGQSFIALLFRTAPKNHLGTRPRMCRRGLLQSSARPPKVGSLLKATTGKQPTATSPISLAFGSLGVRVCWMRHWSSHGRQCADHAARLLHASQLA